MFRLFERERSDTARDWRDAKELLASKPLSPTKREVLNAACDYFIDRLEKHSIVTLVNTDFEARSQQVIRLLKSCNKLDNDFIADARGVIHELPLNSDLKDKLQAAVDSAVVKLDARRADVYSYSKQALIVTTAVMLLTKPGAGMCMLCVDMALWLFSSDAKRGVNAALELYDSLSTMKENTLTPQQPARRYA